MFKGKRYKEKYKNQNQHTIKLSLLLSLGEKGAAMAGL